MVSLTHNRQPVNIQKIYLGLLNVALKLFEVRNNEVDIFLF